MADKGGIGSLFDLASLIIDIVTLGKIKGRDGEIKQVVSPEQLEEIKKRLVPKIFGAGPADEALFAAVMAKLADRRQLEISRFLDRLTAYDKKQFRLAIAILPEESDRILVLNMFSELDDYDQMFQLAKAIGMISGGPGPLKKLEDLIAEKIPDSKDLKKIDRKIGKILNKLADQIEAYNRREI